MNIVHLADVPPQPWRNGGGSTQQLLAWPQEDGWQFRVSVAAIEQDGAFSAFDGVQRWFAVLSGAGVVLKLPQGEQRLTPDSPALCFDGAAAPHCRLLEGATQDLNLMLRQGCEHSRGGMHSATPGSQVEPGPGWRGFYTAEGTTLLHEGGALPVPGGTLVWQHGAQAPQWALPAAAPAARAFWLHAGPP
jgi:uncharacterized protein